MLLKLENIGKIYDSNDILTIGIRGVNLELDYNEFVTIEGESGSGKSTLLNVIGANDSYEEGELYINGFETSHSSESEWEKYREKNIATIFQDFNIIENLTVLENVELALLRIENKKERRRIAKELIEKVGLVKQANQRGSKLSGGEKQRTVIARALAKDAPIILADEPTGNLDVKSSREIAKLLKDVSKDKLVIVVTHNPEFFREYATRRIRIFDGHISEDRVTARPMPGINVENRETVPSGKRNFFNTLHIGFLNYKSRPRFTILMSCALFVCAITLFVVLNIFGNSVIQSTKATIDDVGIRGKIIVSGVGTEITEEELDEIAGNLNAGFSFIDRELSMFEVSVPKTSGMLRSYTVTCLYAPYEYNLGAGEGVLALPASAANDAQYIKDAFLNAEVGIDSITVKKSFSSSEVYLYLSHDDLASNGVKIRAVNTSVKLGETTLIAYTFERSEALSDGTLNLVNSNSYEASKYTAVLSAKADKSYSVSTSVEDRAVGGMIVQMSCNDYDEIFSVGRTSSSQSVLYFSSDALAGAAIEKLPEGYMGLLSVRSVYVQDAGDVFTMNVVYYIALIAISLCFAALISVIFGRSVKIYQSDFAVYRTLGISRKISSRSLYIQMALIFLPSLLLLPLVSLAAVMTPASGFTFITAGNYFFIEIMMFLIVEFVAFRFNKNINGQSIRKSLRRGSK